VRHSRHCSPHNRSSPHRVPAALMGSCPRRGGRPRNGGGVVITLTAEDLRVSYYCAAEVLRRRQRTGEPIPQWLRRHYDRLDTAYRLSDSGHESGCDMGELEADKLITCAEAALIIGCSKRSAQRLAATDLGGQIIGGRWLVKLSAVMEYTEGKQRG